MVLPREISGSIESIGLPHGHPGVMGLERSAKAILQMQGADCADPHAQMTWCRGSAPRVFSISGGPMANASRVSGMIQVLQTLPSPRCGAENQRLVARESGPCAGRSQARDGRGKGRSH
jgi:hypothetical protein